MSWSRDDLFTKARLFANYAGELDGGDPRYPLWMALCLEMLCRAALSQVNPCLLADIRTASDDTANNLFFACGINIGDKAPISIAASTVFRRCRVLIPSFTEAEVRWCIDFAGKRNEELHSGASPYSTFTTEKWSTEFFRIVDLVLTFLKSGIEDIFGKQAAAMAKTLIQGQIAHVKKQTLDSLNQAKAFLQGLTPEEIQARQSTISVLGRNTFVVDCPSGPHKCVVIGEVSHVSKPRLDKDGDIVVSRTVFPTSLICPVCALKLNGHAALSDVGRGEAKTFSEVQDPIDFHGIDVMDYISESEKQQIAENYAESYEPDYGND